MAWSLRGYFPAKHRVNCVVRCGDVFIFNSHMAVVVSGACYKYVRQDVLSKQLNFVGHAPQLVVS